MGCNPSEFGYCYFTGNCICEGAKMTNILKFQTKQDKAKAERLSLTFHVQTDSLDDGSVWYCVGTQSPWGKEIIWDEWRKVDE